MSDTNSGAPQPARELPHGHRQMPSRHIHSEADPRFEAVLIRALEQQATQIDFSPALRAHIVNHLPSRRSHHKQSRLAIGLATTLIIALTLSLAFFLWQPQLLPQQAGHAVTYQVEQTIPAPSTLAHGVSAMEVDPTGHHLVYEPLKQPGVMYTANLSNPAATNILAMREAHSASWSPDGSALVTVVTPPGAAQPLLALVPYGKYMYPLGQVALAADWSAATAQSITYVTQGKDTTTLWATTRDGHPTSLLTHMALTHPVQHLLWSPDGKYLALVVTTSGQAGPAALSQPGRAIYIMDRQSGHLQELVAPGNFSIGTLAWSPDSRLLTYEQDANQSSTSLQTITIATGQTQFSIPIHQKLSGWSWSPDSHTLIYSDGGKLHLHTLAGPGLELPTSTAQQTFPIFLHDGRILILQSTATNGELVLLSPKSA
jgi:glucose/arabinose dehydrogenase